VICIKAYTETEGKMSIYEAIIKEISENINYPYYSAERRIDVILSLFIEDIFKHEKIIGKTSRLVKLAPELPLSNKNNRQSDCVDFVFVEIDNATQKPLNIFFVEIKTDTKSYNRKQLEEYLAIKWQDVVMGVINNIENTKLGYRSKYITLLNRMIELKIVSRTGGKIEYDVNKESSRQDKRKQYEDLKESLEYIKEQEERKQKVIYLGPKLAKDQEVCRVKYIYYSQLESLKCAKNEEWKKLYEILKKCT